MTKVSMYPISIEQPNQNESNGTEGKYKKAIGRNGKVEVQKLNDNIKDPKYYHLWKNTSNLKEGKEANCGNRSSYHCSHKTYYGIAGYRNICPIAGATGTYTQPAKLKFKFKPSAKNIHSTDTIKSVKISFKHRCVGVDVATDKIYTSWGPNFCGFNYYPNNKVITAKFAGQTETWNKNPTLSKDKYDTVTFTFKSTSSHKIKYSHLSEDAIEIQYGNNLSTNPGNVYITDFSIEVEYTAGAKYIEKEQSSLSLYTSSEEQCISTIDCKIEVGYTNGSTKITPSKAPKILNKNKLTITCPSGVTTTNPIVDTDGKTISFSIQDKSNITGEKNVKCVLDDVGTVSFLYTANKRSKPTITIPDKIEKNTTPNNIVSITARGGCAAYIIAYDGSVDNPIYTFSQIDVNNNSNMISQNDIDNFYKVLSKLPCGDHRIIFKRGNESIDEMPSSVITIAPTKYQINFYEMENDVKKKISDKFILPQNKSENKTIIIEYEKTKDLLEDPVFSIINPTYGLNNTQARINSNAIPFKPNKEGESISITAGTYAPGDYVIQVKEPENCGERESNITLSIVPSHKQHFDEIFVRGEDSTAFNYDYLVALEGDTIQEPLYVNTVTLGASYQDIKICTLEEINTNINKPSYIPVTITNASNNDINDIFIELNALIENEDGDLEVSTGEWIEEDGLFYNLTEKFNDYNKDLSNVVSIKNLSEDDDDIDEEDVYIHIRKIYSKQSIEIAIPLISYVEKEVYLQMLLFGEPIGLYNNTDCSKEEYRFENIKLTVYDSIMTDMKIKGELDVLEPNSINCPLQCFKTEGITYYIKNIDSSDLELSNVIIDNDPRLIPYKIEDKNKNEIPLNSQDKIVYKNTVNTKEFNMIGVKVTNKINFNDVDYSNDEVSTITDIDKYNNQVTYNDVVLRGYTNSSGYVTFYVTIPKTKGVEYTIQELAKLCTITIDYPNSHYKIIDDLSVYKPGQTAPLKIRVIAKENEYINQIHFTPDITKPGDYDQITVYYKICNLQNNGGILPTVFKTDSQNYKMMENKVEENILCGVPTSLEVYAKIDKVVVEQTQYNRLYLDVKNKNRFNKDIQICINEKENEAKYSYFDHAIDVGSLEIDNKKIIWNIDYLEKDTRVKGYIDFKGDILGLSEIKISSKDFTEGVIFNKDYCNCPKNN